jgi:hypothetical protein
MTFTDAEELREALIDAVRREEAVLGTSDLYGVRYIIDLSCTVANAWPISGAAGSFEAAKFRRDL